MELLLVLWLGLGVGGDGIPTVAGYKPPSVGSPQRTRPSGGRLFEVEMEEIG